MLRRRSLLAVPLAGCLALAVAPAALAGGAASAGSRIGVIRLAQGHQSSASTKNQSQNWFGYNIGSLEPHRTSFHSIAGTWTVPTAGQHTRGQDEYSATWLGIGGGCTDTSCLVTDGTLIQAGTEQDVAGNGQATYSAWWEIIPEPVTPVTMKVAPGDHMSVSIVETPVSSENWVITIVDTTRGERFSQKVQYTSTYATAEWMDETPVVLDASPLAPLPNLSTTHFDSAAVNGSDPHLVPAEAVSLVDNNGNVIGAPSVPDKEGDGFYDCAWHSTC